MPAVRSRDGTRIHYEASGAGAAVVLLHPNHATSASWAALGWCELLARRGFRSVALDARGFGASGAASAPADLAPGSSTADLAAVLDALGIERAHLVGYSLGAAHALRFATDRPERVCSLVLGGLALGPLVQSGFCIDADPEADRRRALAQRAEVHILSVRDRVYFAAVREVIASAALEPLAASMPPLSVLCVAGRTTASIRPRSIRRCAQQVRRSRSGRFRARATASAWRTRASASRRSSS